MSVMCENEHGWILDHSVYWNMSGQGLLGTHTNPVEMFNGECRQGDKPMVKSSTAGIQTDSARVLHRKGHFNVKTDLFSIFRPFQMDSHFPKYAAKLTSEKSVHQTSSVHQSTAASRRKRKRKKPEEEINPGVIELGCRLMKAHESLVRLGLNLGHFTNTSDLPLNNNTAAREAARCDDWEMGGDVPTDHGQINTQTRTTLTQVEDGKAYTLEALSHTLYSWKGDSPAMISCLHGDCPSLLADQGESPDGMQVDQYLIPPSSTFFMSQADSLHAFVSAVDGRLFDLIVADPPWENKSVKRKKTYSMLAEWELKRLPICQLARPGCVVAVWVTNKPRQIEFVRASLFPQWSVRYLAHWHWVKVTLGGEPVTDIMSQGKKPYESLLLGRYLPQCDKLEVGPENSRPQCDKTEAGPQNNRPQCDNIVRGPQNYRPQGDKTEAGPQNTRPQRYNIVPGLQNNRLQDPPVNKVIVSVPCILHSKKPPMYELLKQYCQSEPDCLELFARNLQPGWTSWGNEVIRHQNLKFYTSQEERT